MTKPKYTPQQYSDLLLAWGILKTPDDWQGFLGLDDAEATVIIEEITGENPVISAHYFHAMRPADAN